MAGADGLLQIGAERILVEMLDATPLVMLDTNLVIQWYTRAAGEVLPLDEPSVGVPLADAMGSLIGRELDRECRLVLRDGTPRNYELQRADDRGVDRAFVLRMDPCWSSDHALTGLVVVARPSEERLLGADTPLDQIMAILGHELRNPLASISIALDLLEMSLSETQSAKHGIDVVKRQTKHLVSLSEGLLDLARVARGKLHLETELFDLDRMLADLVEDREDGIMRRGIKVIVELDPGPVFILGDRTRMTQVFDNILSNAVKFTPAGWIKVSSRKDQAMAVVRIEDSGVGISPEHRESIFRPFVQSRSASNWMGLGLGLSLAKVLVELHGGSIGVESDGRGTGSCFEVRLPCC